MACFSLSNNSIFLLRVLVSADCWGQFWMIADKLYSNMLGEGFASLFFAYLVENLCCLLLGGGNWNASSMFISSYLEILRAKWCLNLPSFYYFFPTMDFSTFHHFMLPRPMRTVSPTTEARVFVSDLKLMLPPPAVLIRRKVFSETPEEFAAAGLCIMYQRNAMYLASDSVSDLLRSTP